MPGFSNSLCYFYVIDAIRIRYFNSNMVEERTTMFIHSATSSKVSRFVSSLEISVTEYQTYNICNFATTYDRQTAKKLAQPIHPSIATAKPLPLPICILQWTQIRDFQTRTRTRNPGLTFPKPENPGSQKEPWFGNNYFDLDIQNAETYQ